LPSYYERRILQVLEHNKEGLTTMGVAEKAGISKTTALKYLASLRSTDRIDFMEVGPAKLWRLTPPKQPKHAAMTISRTEKIESVLKEFKRTAGLESSAVVDNDGLTISADLPWDLNPEKLGSLISRLLQIWSRSAGMAGMDPLKAIIVEGEKGRIVARSEGNVLLIAFSGQDTR
jgi:predicted regulator of Ras-like GTPase activity (Roadblock/LC7/MglB family)